MYFLGIDGGGTKTAFEIIDEKGNIIFSIKTPTCSYIQIGKENFGKVVHEGAKDVCAKAGISLDDITFSCIGIPSFGEIASDVPDLTRITEEALGKNVVCVNDVVVAWAGSLACKPGINLLAGTGSMGYGVDTNGKSARSGGWGYFCGDEGSAHWLGKKTIELFTKEADGRYEKGPMYKIIYDEFSLESDFDFISVVYDKLDRKRDAVAKLQILLNKAADEGDKYAVQLYKDAAYELSLIIRAIIGSLDFPKTAPVNISYSGGVFKAGGYIFDPLKENLCDINYTLSEPLLIPVTGAALYALREVCDCDDSIVSNLCKQDSDY